MNLPSLKILSYVFGLSLLFSRLYADHSETAPPNFGGTFLSASATSLKPHEFLVQPFFSLTNQYGSYDESWDQVNEPRQLQEGLTLFLQRGVVPKIDVSLVTSAVRSTMEGHTSIEMGDVVVTAGMQFLAEDLHGARPNIKFSIGEIFPTGKSQQLNIDLGGLDSGGWGSFDTLFILSFSKIFFLSHPLNVTLNLFTSIPSLVKVRGVNVYGGDPSTRGTVDPGQFYLANLAFEYQLPQPQWIVGVDIHYEHAESSNFISGVTKTFVGLPSSEEFSLAPCLEYVVNEKLGFLIGSWFSVTGRNTEAYAKGLFSFYYTF